MSAPYLIHLTAAQADAATRERPVLVLAGAGTGKTKTLTAAVAYRIEARSIVPARIPGGDLHEQGGGRNDDAHPVGARRHRSPVLDRYVPRAWRTTAAERAGCRRVAARLEIMMPTTAAVWSSAP